VGNLCIYIFGYVTERYVMSPSMEETGGEEGGTPAQDRRTSCLLDSSPREVRQYSTVQYRFSTNVFWKFLAEVTHQLSVDEI
jgi:hypothetical protein